MLRSGLALSFLALCLNGSSQASAASADGNVEWAGVSHRLEQDLRPRVPIGGEGFEVHLRTWANDLTGLVVEWSASTGSGTAVAQVDRTLGPYAVWKAVIPASAPSAQVRYHFSLFDGGDNDFYGAAGMATTPPATANRFLVDFATLSHAPRGATAHPTGGVVFRVWSPGTTSAHVRGQFNNWGLGNPMTRLGEDWIARVPNAAVNHRYKFFFDNSVWNTDPNARSLDAGDNYNAIVQDASLFPWTSDGFQTPPLEEMVIYQLHVGTFPGRNDPLGSVFFPGKYVDAANRVAHLVELGVNAVMLNPVTEFPTDESAGYNPVVQSAPERAYGLPNDLRRLVDACHANEIAVLLDIVWNHVTISDNVLWNYDGNQIYFDTPIQDTPWGAQADFDEPAVRQLYLDSAHLWLEEFRIDGFRFDASDFMDIGQHVVSGWTLMQELNDAVDNRWADRVVIAEQLPDDAFVTTPTSSGGAGFDAQYYDRFTDDLRQELLDAAFGDPEMWKIRDIVNGSGPYLSGNRVVNYLELHDEAWPSSGGQRMVKTIDGTAPHDDVWAKGRTKLGQGLVMLAPGVPAILMGTEWLEDTGFGTSAAERIDWGKKTTYGGIFAFYRDLIGLRTSLPGLRADAFSQVFHLNESGNVIGFRRGLGDDTVLVLANFSNGAYFDYRIGVPSSGDYEVLLDSQAAQYEGSGASHPAALPSQPVGWDNMGQSITLDLAAMSVVVLRKDPGPTAVGPAEELATRLALAPARPNPARGLTAVSYTLPEAGEVRVELFDLRGRRVRVLEDGRRAAGAHVLEVDTRELPRGTYFVRVRAGAEVSTRKVSVLD